MIGYAVMMSALILAWIRGEDQVNKCVSACG